MNWTRPQQDTNGYLSAHFVHIMKTVYPEVCYEQAPPLRHTVEITEAMRRIGVISRTTYREYAIWVDVEAGHEPTETQVKEMRLMRLFCACGKGKKFSKLRYMTLKAEGKLEAKLEQLGIK